MVEERRGRGGRAGVLYEVRLDTLPEPLQTAFKARNRPVQLPLRLDDAASAERRERRAIIEPIIAHPAGSAERRAALRAVAATPVIRNGQRVTLPERTLRNWIAAFDAGGEAALQRKARKDKGTAAVEITQRWDRVAGELQEAFRVEIATKLHRFLMSRWGDGCSFAHVKRLAEDRLVKLTREAGCGLSEAELSTACRLPKHVVETGRSDGRKIFIRRRDAKAFDDRRPRVRLTSRGLAPMDLIYGDIHHVDIYLRRTDGSLATPKAISWLDAANRRFKIDLVLCEPGTGIRNADLIQSFVDLTQDPHWGVPRNLYLDNGSEYGFADFLGDPLRLASLGCQVSPMRGPVTRAQPYNAAAKGIIEGSFRNLERLLVPFKGSIPGNRMLTRSANLGKAPDPYDGSFEQFASVFAGMVTFYNTQKQKGELRGLSPQVAYASAVEAGWRRLDVDADALRTAFSVRETRKITRGTIRVGAEVFYADKLVRHDGETVVIQRPKYLKWDGVPVFTRDGTFIDVAKLDEAHERGSLAGAREAARRRRAALDTAAEIVRQADGEDAIELTIAAGDAAPMPPTPDSAGEITIAIDAREAGRQLRETPGDTRRREHARKQKAQRDRLTLLQQHGMAK